MPSYPTIEHCVGNTPLVRLQRMGADTGNTLLLKLEGNNPAGSVKDRPAMSMIQRAEERGEISPGQVLIEATSGNTGIALAMAAAIKGYRLKLIMPSHMSDERKLAMAAYGAELIEVTQEEGMEGARDLALQMQAEGVGRVLDQFGNPDNPEAHYRGTGPEIWRDTEGTVTHFVSSMGTTGTIMGTSRFLKSQTPMSRSWGCSLKMVPAFPASGAGPRLTCPKYMTRPGLTASSISASVNPRKPCANWPGWRAYLPAYPPAAPSRVCCAWQPRSRTR